MFTIEIVYPKGSVIHIRRCMADIAGMRAAVLEGGAESVGAKRISDVESRRKILLTSERDGDEELMEGGSELLSYVEQVEAWLCALCSGPISAFPQLIAFLEPGAVSVIYSRYFSDSRYLINGCICILCREIGTIWKPSLWLRAVSRERGDLRILLVFLLYIKIGLYMYIVYVIGRLRPCEQIYY
jgi:hypothetical protein